MRVGPRDYALRPGSQGLGQLACLMSGMPLLPHLSPEQQLSSTPGQAPSAPLRTHFQALSSAAALKAPVRAPGYDISTRLARFYLAPLPTP